MSDFLNLELEALVRPPMRVSRDVTTEQPLKPLESYFWYSSLGVRFCLENPQLTNMVQVLI